MISGQRTTAPLAPLTVILDYFLWGACEREVNKHPHSTKASLKAKINEATASLDKVMVASACRRVRSRIERVVDAEGGIHLVRPDVDKARRKSSNLEVNTSICRNYGIFL